MARGRLPSAVVSRSLPCLPCLPYAPALAVLLLYLWAFLEHAWGLVTFPYQVDYGEMPELNRAWLLAHGRPIYVDWSAPPYQMANYPPLYSLASAGGVALWGPQFFTGRLVSLASTLITALAIGVTAAAILPRRPAGLLGGTIAALLYVAGYPVWSWGALQRVDAFAVALEWVGVAVFAAGWLRRRRPASVMATVPLFLAAAFARQTVAAGAWAAYGVLLARRPRLGLAAVAAYAAGGLGLFALLLGATRGQFWRHIVTGNVNQWRWSIVDFYWQPFWQILHWTFPLALLALALGLLRRRSQLPLLYLPAAAATALTIGKIGSNVNYLLQLWAVLALLLGLACGEVSAAGEWGPRPSRASVGGPSLGAAQLQSSEPRGRPWAQPGWRVLGAPARRSREGVPYREGWPISERLAKGYRTASDPGRGAEGAPPRLRPVVALPANAVLALWLLVGLQQAYHVPHLNGEVLLPYGKAARVLGAARWASLPLWRLDPLGGDPAALEERALVRYNPLLGPRDAEHARLAEQLVRDAPGDVLGEEMNFTVTTGKRIYWQPFEFSQLAAQGQWDEGPLLEDTRRGRFGAVVLRFRLGDDPLWRRERIDNQMITALQAGYRLDAVYGDYYLYRPKAP